MTVLGWRVLNGAVLVLVLGACASNRPPAEKGTKDMATETKGTTGGQVARRWRVFEGEQLVMEVSDVPGPLISTAAPPPGLRPVMHPFLTAASRSAHHEHRLKAILDTATSTADFLDKLRAAGFVVQPVEPPAK